ncbi:MAG: hypothetical protein ABIY47_06695 [Opitutaceae bacterium]
MESSTPPPLAPLLRDQRKVDADHLKLLRVFHFVLAGLTVIGLGFLFLHWLVMRTVFENPEIWKNQNNAPPPKEFIAIFKWFYAFAGVMIVASGIANLVSGLCIRRRTAHTFSLIVAGLNCLDEGRSGLTSALKAARA